MKVKNTFIIFIVSGFWHGANWKFVVWGALNALYFLPLLLTNKNRKNLNTVAVGKWLPSFRELLSMSITFMLTVFAWIFFRAENLNHAFEYLLNLLVIRTFFILKSYSPHKLIILILCVFILIEWVGRNDKYALEKLGFRRNKKFRYLLYYMLIFSIFWFGGKSQEFIYFQF